MKSIKSINKNLLNKFNDEDKKEFETLNEINNNEIPQNLGQNEIKENIIKYINDNNCITKDIIEKLKINKKLIKKYFLCKEKYYAELKKQNLLMNKTNHKQM